VGSRLILMLGPSMDYPGGMTEVVRLYSKKRVFEVWPLRFVSTYDRRGLITQLRTWLPALCTVLMLLARRRVALVHVHSAAHGSFWRKSAICAIAYLFRTPYVFHVHSGKFSVFYRRDCSGFAQAWVRRTLRNAARVIVLSRHWRDEVHDMEPTARVTIIGNPVNAPVSLPPLRHPARTVLFLNWLTEEKGVHDLVRAMPQILRSVPQARFVLAGTGDVLAGTRDVESVRHLIKSLSIEHVVNLPGWVDGEQKNEFLRKADVFVLPSYFEGLSIGLLEAMACGAPVVATAVGGTPDVIENRVNGLLVEPAQPDALAQAIVTMLTDDALRTRLREAAHRDVCARYSLDSAVGSLESLYRELGIHVDSISRRAHSKAS